jgi:hypothetical protein
MDKNISMIFKCYAQYAYILQSQAAINVLSSMIDILITYKLNSTVFNILLIFSIFNFLLLSRHQYKL